jgi:hypothetical protein
MQKIVYANRRAFDKPKQYINAIYTLIEGDIYSNNEVIKYIRLDELPLRFINELIGSNGTSYYEQSDIGEQILTGKFYVDYDMGIIRFNDFDELPASFQITYKGLGSVLLSSDVAEMTTPNTYDTVKMTGRDIDTLRTNGVYYGYDVFSEEFKNINPSGLPDGVPETNFAFIEVNEYTINKDLPDRKVVVQKIFFLKEAENLSELYVNSGYTRVLDFNTYGEDEEIYTDYSYHSLEDRLDEIQNHLNNIDISIINLTGRMTTAEQNIQEIIDNQAAETHFRGYYNALGDLDPTILLNPRLGDYAYVAQSAQTYKNLATKQCTLDTSTAFITYVDTSADWDWIRRGAKVEGDGIAENTIVVNDPFRNASNEVVIELSSNPTSSGQEDIFFINSYLYLESFDTPSTTNNRWDFYIQGPTGFWQDSNQLIPNQTVEPGELPNIRRASDSANPMGNAGTTDEYARIDHIHIWQIDPGNINTTYIRTVDGVPLSRLEDTTSPANIRVEDEIHSNEAVTADEISNIRITGKYLLTNVSRDAFSGQFVPFIQDTNKAILIVEQLPGTTEVRQSAYLFNADYSPMDLLYSERNNGITRITPSAWQSIIKPTTERMFKDGFKCYSIQEVTGAGGLTPTITFPTGSTCLINFNINTIKSLYKNDINYLITNGDLISSANKTITLTLPTEVTELGYEIDLYFQDNTPNITATNNRLRSFVVNKGYSNPYIILSLPYSRQPIPTNYQVGNWYYSEVDNMLCTVELDAFIPISVVFMGRYRIYKESNILKSEIIRMAEIGYSKLPFSIDDIHENSQIIAGQIINWL